MVVEDALQHEAGTEETISSDDASKRVRQITHRCEGKTLKWDRVQTPSRRSSQQMRKLHLSAKPDQSGFLNRSRR